MKGPILLTLALLTGTALSAPTTDPSSLVRDAVALQHRVWRDLDRHCYFQHTLKEPPDGHPGLRREEHLEEVCLQERTADSQRQRELLDLALQAFHFRPVEESAVEEGPVVVELTPRPDFRPTSTTGEMLKHVTGRVWIDRQTHHMVMLKMRVESDFKIWGGLAATVHKGATFELRQKPFNGVWLPYFRDQRWEGRVALIRRAGEHFRLERWAFHNASSTGPQYVSFSGLRSHPAQ